MFSSACFTEAGNVFPIKGIHDLFLKTSAKLPRNRC